MTMLIAFYSLVKNWCHHSLVIIFINNNAFYILAALKTKKGFSTNCLNKIFLSQTMKYFSILLAFSKSLISKNWSNATIIVVQFKIVLLQIKLMQSDFVPHTNIFLNISVFQKVWFQNWCIFLFEFQNWCGFFLIIIVQKQRNNWNWWRWIRLVRI